MPLERPPIRLVLIWHFHQPDYTDPETGAPSLPWTRLHALKDYADMAEALERHPGVRATINVVPTLLDQLEALADPAAVDDPYLAAARKDAAALGAEERRFVVGHFFSFHREILARGLGRMRELSALRGDYDLDEVPDRVVERFDEGALRDLQVLFHLAWSGPLLRSEQAVAELFRKGRGFTEDDKRHLLDVQQKFVAGVLPRWRKLSDSGRVEFAVSPYYHPILPLLCDLESAREALPGLKLPPTRFVHPEDAEAQLQEAVGAYRARFGRTPDGGWPSEGAISEASLVRMAKAGFGWAASDEDVLFGSLGERLPADPWVAEVRRGTLLYRPWQAPEGPALLFRDHDLSDRIGFVYSSWNPRLAAVDFVHRLLHLREILPAEEGPYTVSVILDGENPWEYYEDLGRPFLDALYGALEEESGVTTLTAAQATGDAAARELPRVVAGSWIGRNLATWIGHPEKNRAWELLIATREAVERARGKPDRSDPAWRAVLTAEGSDWFWWFGDDHPTPYAAHFDAAFRRQLRFAREAAGLPVPEELDRPIRTGGARGFLAPSGPVHPVLDGRVTDYFEWLQAGSAEALSGAMQAAARLVRFVHFGSDGERLYLRLDPCVAPASESLRDGLVRLRVSHAPEPLVTLVLSAAAGEAKGGTKVAVDRVVEIAVPLEILRGPGEGVRFQVEVESAEGFVQRVPAEGSLQLPDPEEDPSRYDWFV